MQTAEPVLSNCKQLFVSPTGREDEEEAVSVPGGRTWADWARQETAPLQDIGSMPIMFESASSHVYEATLPAAPAHPSLPAPDLPVPYMVAPWCRQ